MEWRWGTPRKDMGPVEVLWDGDGAPPPQVWTDKQTETNTFPHPSDAGGNDALCSGKIDPTAPCVASENWS